MTLHPALARGGVAVVTGAASGIGLAAAERMVALGLRVALVDIDEAALAAARARLGDVLALCADVARPEEALRVRDAVLERLGGVDFLMLNAGIEGGGALFEDEARFARILAVNQGGVVHFIQAFVPGMIGHGRPCAVTVTGSKQGITCPPGDTAYNVSKAAVKALTEALAHELRQRTGGRATAHLLIPGFTFTGFTRARLGPEADKPAAAWTPEQVVSFMLEGMAAGDFYLLCPDNDVTRAIDEKRIRWAADDIVMNRPALSRWHPDHAAAFAAFMNEAPR